MLPHEKTEILGCKSVKLLYFIPILPTVVQSMMFHLHADLPYCGLKRAKKALIPKLTGNNITPILVNKSIKKLFTLNTFFNTC